MEIFLNILFNLLSTLFNVFSISLVIPFLDLLFQKNQADYDKILSAGDPGFALSAKTLIEKINYEMVFRIETLPDFDRMTGVIWVCAAILVGIFCKNLFRYLAMYVIATMRNGIMYNLRNALYHKVLNLPLSFYSNEKKGNILSKSGQDTTQIEWTVLQSIEMLFKEPIAITAFILWLYSMSWELTLFIFLLLPLTGIVIGGIGKSLKKSSKKSQEKMGDLFTLMEETLTGLRIIKAFNAESILYKRYQNLNDNYRSHMTKMYRKRDLASPFSEFLGIGVVVTIIVYGGILILEEKTLEPSIFIGFIAVFTQLIPHSKNLTTTYMNIQNAVPSINRVNDILDADLKITESTSAQSYPQFKSSLKFEGVTFSYEKGTEVLKDISFEIKKGETIALVGSSGGGKSTIADLIPRFYDVNKGKITLDGIDIKNIKIKDLRNRIGLVSQQAVLFNDSIYNNIVFGRENCTKEQAIEAAKIANAYDFIMQTKNGFDSNIGDTGSKLSGGQKQRISIARAILANPELLILDEATSALDTESESLVQSALNRLMHQKTSLIIAHRLSTIQNADKILVIDQGKIVESGSHTELMAQKGIYKKLNELQQFKDD